MSHPKSASKGAARKRSGRGGGRGPGAARGSGNPNDEDMLVQRLRSSLGRFKANFELRREMEPAEASDVNDSNGGTAAASAAAAAAAAAAPDAGAASKKHRDKKKNSKKSKKKKKKKRSTSTSPTGSSAESSAGSSGSSGHPSAEETNRLLDDVATHMRNVCNKLEEKRQERLKLANQGKPSDHLLWYEGQQSRDATATALNEYVTYCELRSRDFRRDHLGGEEQQFACFVRDRNDRPVVKRWSELKDGRGGKWSRTKLQVTDSTVFHQVAVRFPDDPQFGRWAGGSVNVWMVLADNVVPTRRRWHWCCDDGEEIMWTPGPEVATKWGWAYGPLEAACFCLRIPFRFRGGWALFPGDAQFLRVPDAPPSAPARQGSSQLQHDLVHESAALRSLQFIEDTQNRFSYSDAGQRVVTFAMLQELVNNAAEQSNTNKNAPVEPEAKELRKLINDKNQHMKLIVNSGVHCVSNSDSSSVMQQGSAGSSLKRITATLSVYKSKWKKGKAHFQVKQDQPVARAGSKSVRLPTAALFGHGSLSADYYLVSIEWGMARKFSYWGRQRHDRKPRKGTKKQKGARKRGRRQWGRRGGRGRKGAKDANSKES